MLIGTRLWCKGQERPQISVSQSVTQVAREFKARSTCRPRSRRISTFEFWFRHLFTADDEDDDDSDDDGQRVSKMSCPAPSQALFAAQRSEGACPRVRHLLTGTFNTHFLHLLSFDSLTRTLSVLASLPAQGPHSFLAAGRSSSSAGKLVDRVYATTWAQEKTLSAWSIDWHGEAAQVRLINSVPISEKSKQKPFQPDVFAESSSREQLQHHPMSMSSLRRTPA